jgi:hypothetical protein
MNTPSPARVRACLPLLAALPAVVLLAGCLDRGYTFSTTATYDVPALGFRAVVAAHGTVAPGADISEDGVLRAVLLRLGGTTNPVVTLQTTNLPTARTITYTIGTNAPLTLPWGSIDSIPSLQTVLNQAGFTNPMPAAVEESRNAIEGTSYGPKGTMIGSGTHVVAVSVKPTFKR